MIVVAPPSGGIPPTYSHDCPHCLARVRISEARRQAHREPCRSGAVDVALLRCPTCNLVLCAEVIWTSAAPAPLSQWERGTCY
ncbi:MAG TPA: hypothetical protein VHS99_24320 [Chloroflexota bacterium]|jgi:hypothetical protein|nr:hypothetical protein [Chloroflexota bacterium]